jgi:ATP-dependent Lhr-like helicase
MNLPASASERSSAYDRLHPGVRRWVWQQGWSDLRPVQKAAIDAILTGGRDVIIAAATASGKTEAAFLPLISRIADEPGGGFRLLYVSPLKALINDQFRRLDGLCEALELPVFRWHGDVTASHKRKARDTPAGILLITPESLEATLVRRGLEAERLFGALEAVVIDELHAFIGNPRGRQMQSLLHRIEVAAQRHIPRIGLSATLGDNLAPARAFLRPGAAEPALLAEDRRGGQEIRLQLRGYVRAPRAEPAPSPPDETHADADAAVARAIAAHLFKTLRGGQNLIFAGRRSEVEIYADLLRTESEACGVPNEFLPHHGSLSRDHREMVEQRLRDNQIPTTAVCTSTLELGIDIGAIAAVAQIGPPWSVASLRQRLGRAGRREGQAAILRLYVAEPALSARDTPPDALRFGLVQSVAMVRLLLQGWAEPPRSAAMDISTLLQQTLALIAESGGLHARDAYRVLCSSGPFAVPQRLYVDLLRRMGEAEVALIEQAPDGTLLLGRAGERLVDHHDFYAAFVTADEYRVLHGSRTLGTLPVVSPLMVGATILFAGRRWQVLEVADREKLISVAPSTAGAPPLFGGGGGDLHDRVVAEMFDLYRSADEPPFLDPAAHALLTEGRAGFARHRLAETAMIDEGGTLWLFPWVGTIRLGTLVLALRAAGLDANSRGVAIEIADSTQEALAASLRTLAAAPPPDPRGLAESCAARAIGKYDHLLSDALQIESYASQRLDTATLPALAGDLLRRGLVENRTPA